MSHRRRRNPVCTHLGSVGEESRDCGVKLDGIGVEFDGGREIAGVKGRVAFVLEIDGFL